MKRHRQKDRTDDPTIRCLYDEYLVDLDDYKAELEAAKDLQAPAKDLWFIVSRIAHLRNQLRVLAPALSLDPDAID